MFVFLSFNYTTTEQRINMIFTLTFKARKLTQANFFPENINDFQGICEKLKFTRAFQFFYSWSIALRIPKNVI